MSLKPGDSLFRYYPEYQVWHAGIVCYVGKGRDIESVEILEFDSSDCVSKVNLRQFMKGRKYFWVASYDLEKLHYGESAFRCIRDRLRVGIDKWKECDIKYTINNYNCEYFVRMCVFKDENMWKSTQTDFMSKSKTMILLKMCTIFLGSILDKANHSMEIEKNSSDRKYDYPYIIVNDEYQKIEKQCH